MKCSAKSLGNVRHEILLGKLPIAYFKFWATSVTSKLLFVPCITILKKFFCLLGYFEHLSNNYYVLATV